MDHMSCLTCEHHIYLATDTIKFYSPNSHKKHAYTIIKLINFVNGGFTGFYSKAEAFSEHALHRTSSTACTTFTIYVCIASIRN